MTDAPPVPRVLIVDDDPMNMRVLTRWLQKEGFSARCAQSAEAALQLLEKEPVDAILTDIELPGLSGFEAIGKFQVLSKAPIIIMTGHADDQLRKDALALGAKFFLEKPFELGNLTSAVRRAVDGRA